MWNRRKSGLALVKKSNFYVCFLGARESNGLKGTNVVMPVLTNLIRNSYEHEPSKVTLQMSEKGVKIVQSVPVITKSGKLKSDVIKFLVPHYSISFAMVGPPPHDDTIACVFLIFNPETRCCVHVHCYRCDSAATAALLNASMQALINRPENIKRFTELEYRLRLRGLLDGPSSHIRNSELDLMALYRSGENGGPSSQRLMSHRPSAGGGNGMPVNNRGRMFHSTGNLCHSSSSSPYEDMDMTPNSCSLDPEAGERGDSNRVSMLHNVVFDELKQKLKNREKCPILFPPKDYLSTWKTFNKVPARPAMATKNGGGIWDSGGHRSNFMAAANFGSSTRDLSSGAADFNKYTLPDLIDHGLYPKTSCKHALETSSTSGVGSDSSSTESSKQKDYSQTTSDDYSEIGGISKRGLSTSQKQSNHQHQQQNPYKSNNQFIQQSKKHELGFDGGVRARDIKFIDSNNNNNFSHNHTDSNSSSVPTGSSSSAALSNILTPTPRPSPSPQMPPIKYYHQNNGLVNKNDRTAGTDRHHNQQSSFVVENSAPSASSSSSSAGKLITRYNNNSPKTNNGNLLINRIHPDNDDQVNTSSLNSAEKGMMMAYKQNKTSRPGVVANQHQLVEKYHPRDVRERDFRDTRPKFDNDIRSPTSSQPSNPTSGAGNRKESRAFGDTIKYEIKPSYQLTGSNLDNVGKDRSKLAQFAASSNWMINKPTRFFSVEDLSVARSRRSIVEPTPMRESLWHLPSLVDPFGKMCENEPDNKFTSSSGRDFIPSDRSNQSNGLGGYANRRGGLMKQDRAQKCASWYVPPTTQF